MNFDGSLFGLRTDGIEDDYVHAAITRAAFGSVVGSNRMKLGEASGGKTGWVEVISLDENLNELRGAGAGKFPVGIETFAVDGYVVGMALDTKKFRAFAKDRGKTIDCAAG